MFADMVGYTALMQEDEGLAHARRERQRAALSELVPRYNGKVLQHYGDGTLSVFHSAVEAVECAVSIQLEMRRDPVIPLRIGVQIGDVVHDRDGVYGDSVNVAARIEALAAPGGILISGKVFDDIKNHPSLTTVPCGSVRLKSVKQPVRLFAVATEGLPVPTTADLRAAAVERGVGITTAANPETDDPLIGGTKLGVGEAFLHKIRERAVVQWSLVYLATAWALVEIVQFVSRQNGWPSVVPQGFALIAFAGLLIAVVVAWYHGERGRQRIRRSEAGIYLVLVLSTAAALSMLARQPGTATANGAGLLAPVPIDADRASVAVLPFANLSDDEANAFFASGLHDEVMTQLQKVAGLRVISRTSVMEYAESRPNVRVIAGNLGVSHVTEATVQRIGDRLRVHVQLIDARTDAHVWAERYDREVEDAFDVQSSIAQMIAQALATRLTAQERGALSRPPTENAEAYRLYLQGRDYLLRPGYRRDHFTAAEALYERAAALDPEFALVRAELSRVHGLLYWESFDPSPDRIEAQRAEAEAALQLDPDLPQAHVALGWTHYVAGDYPAALEEYQIALEGLPNDADVVAAIGYTHRRLGHWPAVFEAFERATALSPRNANLIYDLGGHSFLATRRYAEAAEAYQRAETLAPDLYDAAIHKGHTYVHWRGELDTLAAVVARLPADLHLPEIELARVEFALWSREPERLLAYAAATPWSVFETQIVYRPKALYSAWAHRLHGDEGAARRAFDSARVVLERLLGENPDDWRLINSLGYAYAGLGRSHEAAELAERSMRSRQRAGLEISEAPARIFAQAGLAERSIDYLETLLEADSPVGAHTLRLDPLFDPIRSHPDFRALTEAPGSSP